MRERFMINQVPFRKYTSHGNNFVMLDEVTAQVLSELSKSKFAYQATDINYGVGSDNFIVIQRCIPQILKEINEAREYWDQPPDSMAAEFVFRMFEPDGEEALSCANGLMCIANYLFDRYGIDSARIMTEIPSSRPRVVTVGTNPSGMANWIHLGQPRQIPVELAQAPPIKPYDETIDTFENIEIAFRKHDLAPFADTQSLKISGYLLFTGEPHLVIFPDIGFSLKRLAQTIFVSSDPAGSKTNNHEKRASFGSWLIHHIGNYLNKKYAHIFPKGINVNFARIIDSSGVFEYRCFERGLYRETLSCGTGALAVSSVVKKLNMLSGNPITAWPHRSRWNNPEAHILLEENENGWLLYGNPLMLFEGEFLVQEPVVQLSADIDVAAIRAKQGRQLNLLETAEIGRRSDVKSWRLM